MEALEMGMEFLEQRLGTGFGTLTPWLLLWTIRKDSLGRGWEKR